MPSIWVCGAPNTWVIGSASGGAQSLTDLAGVSGVRGTTGFVQMSGGSAFAENDCARFDANGNLVSAGAPCGAGGNAGSAYMAGPGVVIAGSQISVDESVHPYYYTSAGVPAGNCAPGRDWHVDTAANDAYACVAPGVWKHLTAVRSGSGVPAANACQTSQQAGTLYVRTEGGTNGALWVCTKTGDGAYGWQAAGAQASVGASDHTTVQDAEEFWPTLNSSMQIGKLGWGLVTAGALGSVAAANAEANHPGVYRLLTGTAANSVAALELRGTSGVLPIAGEMWGTGNWESRWTFRTATPMTEYKIRLGFVSGATADPASTGAWVRFGSSAGCTANFQDTGFVYETRNGAVSTTSAGPAISPGTWYTVRLRGVEAGAVGFSVSTNGGAFSPETVLAANVPDSLTTPFAQVITCDGAAKQLLVDYWSFSRTGLAR